MGPRRSAISVSPPLRLANGNTLIPTGNGHGVLEVTPERKSCGRFGQNDLPRDDARLGDDARSITEWQLPDRQLPRRSGPTACSWNSIRKTKKVVWAFDQFEHVW